MEQQAREALGANHRAEMEVNFGIARNKRRQRQEEYKAVTKLKRFKDGGLKKGKQGSS